jgi:hypothetical protein
MGKEIFYLRELKHFSFWILLSWRTLKLESLHFVQSLWRKIKFWLDFNWLKAKSISYIFSLLPYFEKMKVGLWDHHAVYVSVYFPLSNIECLNQSLRNLVFISWHLDSSQWHTSQIPLITLMCLYVYPPTIARQQLSKSITAAMNTPWQ